MTPLGTSGGDHFIKRAWLLILVTVIPTGAPSGTEGETLNRMNSTKAQNPLHYGGAHSA